MPLYSAEEFAAFWATLEDDLVEQNNAGAASANGTKKEKTHAS
jgi:hypothetical protein